MSKKTSVGLDSAERSEIEILKYRGYSIRKIAEVLGRSPNEISGYLKVHPELGFYVSNKQLYAWLYSSWQKGGVENANKMLRRYFPKGTDFSKITQSQVNSALWTINNKPRQSLGFKSALQCAVEKGLLLDVVSY